MAEPDAAGHAPVSGPEPQAPEGSRSHTLVEIQRDIDRAIAPLLAAEKAAEREADRCLAPVLAVARQFEQDQKRLAAMVGKAIGPYLLPLSGVPSPRQTTSPPRDSKGRRQPAAPSVSAHAAPAFDAGPAARSALVETIFAEVWERLAGPLAGETAAFKEEVRTTIEELRKALAAQVPPSTPQSGRPAFEVDPGKKLLAALRQAFPGFNPTDRWWVHAERELKNAHHRSNPEGHEAFCAAYQNWSAEDLIGHLEAEGRIKPASAPRGKSVCERLRETHKEDADFAETAPERELARKIGKKSPGCFSKSHYWNTVLKPRRAEVRARAQLARAGRKSNAAEPSKAQARADNWDQRDAVRRLDSQIDGGH